PLACCSIVTGPRQVQSALLLVAAGGAALFGAAHAFAPLVLARALVGLGVSAALTSGFKALVLWFPKQRLALVNGCMVMLGALGAVTATGSSRTAGRLDRLAQLIRAPRGTFRGMCSDRLFRRSGRGAHCAGPARSGHDQFETDLRGLSFLAIGAALGDVCWDCLGLAGVVGSAVAHRCRGARAAGSRSAPVRHGARAECRCAGYGHRRRKPAGAWRSAPCRLGDRRDAVHSGPTRIDLAVADTVPNMLGCRGRCRCYLGSQLREPG